MDEAIHPALGPVTITALKPGMPGLDGLKCVGCKTPIRYTIAHGKRSRTKWIHAYLSLKSGESHASSCRNTMRGQITELVAQSKAATGNEVLDDDGTVVTFRLHVVSELVQSTVKDAKEAKPGEGADARVR